MSQYPDRAFILSQRVLIPKAVAGERGVQGMIVAHQEFINREPVYTVRWLSASDEWKLADVSEPDLRRTYEL